MNKPHLYQLERGAWCCADGRWLGWGKTPCAAWHSWQKRLKRTSCIHQVHTALQRRRLMAAKHDAGVHGV